MRRTSLVVGLAALAAALTVGPASAHNQARKNKGLGFDADFAAPGSNNESDSGCANVSC